MKRSLLVRSVVTMSVAGLLLTGCARESETPTAAASSSPAVVTPTAPVSVWNVDEDKDATWTRQLKEIKQMLQRVHGAKSTKAAEVRTEQMIDLEKVLTEMAAAGGPEGVGHVACEVMPIQLLSYEDSDSADMVSMQIGAYWSAAVAAAANEPGASFKDVELDARMEEECEDVHDDVLKTMGLRTLNKMYRLPQVSPTS
ncbi:hypothetical protein [Kineosporia mesophila]|uniref:hypothetical protein n=1 Tax=Kineosporia mesophila TaxID=566012 RepID=UPI001E64D9E2|nr:hypothetical protein [Kineosporia mesophila]MCD5348965.1 hypothetical protein [Kineosporia mesophila]